MAGKDTALGESFRPGLPVAVGVDWASNCRAWRSARRRAALFQALRSGSSARSRVWPTISAGLGVTGFGGGPMRGAALAAARVREGGGGLVIQVTGQAGP